MYGRKIVFLRKANTGDHISPCVETSQRTPLTLHGPTRITDVGCAVKEVGCTLIDRRRERRAER